MKIEFKSLSYFFLAAFLSSSLILPHGADAATKKALPRCKNGFCAAKVSVTPGADEKQFTNPTTRCLTAEMNKLHGQVVAQMQKDIQKYGQGHDAVAKVYQDKIDILWSAMHEPYCGYGSQGMKAVKHSWDKTVKNTRTAFLEAVGANQLAKK